jgi:modulator of FtsH protease
MHPTTNDVATPSAGVVVPQVPITAAGANSTRVLRNTYALLAMTLVFSAAVAAASMSLSAPVPGLALTLAGFFGLFYIVSKLRDSAWALPAVFALTGFIGYTLGPLMTHTLALPGGGQVVALALAVTGATFLAMSAFALTSRRDFTFMGSFLLAGMLVALLSGLAAVLFALPAVGVVVSGMVAALASGLILFETSRILHGGETNYVMATVSLYVSIANLFSSLLSLLGMGSSSE